MAPFFIQIIFLHTGVFYRKTPGIGSPEVQDLNTLRNDLGVFPKLTTSIDLIAFVNHGGNVVVKMGRFIYWNSGFVTVYRRITPILKTVVPFSAMVGFNTFTGTRWRFKNDISDNTTADMITDISFNAGSGVVAGNSVTIEYTETTRQLSSQLSLVYKGWDFAHDRPYAKSPTGNFPAQPMLTYSAIIPNMEFIKGDLSVGEVLFNLLDEGWGHVAANINDRLRIAAMLDKIILKEPNGSVILAFGGKNGF